MASFAETVSAFCRTTKDGIDESRRIVIIKLFTAIILDTPVDTGRLRGNWITSIGTPVKEVLDVVSKEGAIEEVIQVAGEVKGDDAVYLCNSLPYAYRIEFEGWSHKKAPAGMLRKNIMRFEMLMDRELRRVAR